MYSLDLNRMVSFPAFRRHQLSPAWAPTGPRSRSPPRAAEIRRFIAWIPREQPEAHYILQGPRRFSDLEPQDRRADRLGQRPHGLPQVYTMEADGTNVQRLTDQGYAVSPAWSPNGQFLVFSWMRSYGPGAPGAQDIYIMDIASKQWVQLTHDGGRNDFPYWSPDGRHIIFQSSRAGSDQIWTMLADGTNQKQLTFAGANTQPNWSWK